MTVDVHRHRRSVVHIDSARDHGARGAASAIFVKQNHADVLVVLYGWPGITFDSGMRPSHENLFRLNIKVRDPELTELNRSLDARHEQVATVCKRVILLLKGEERKAPEDVCKG